MTSAEASEPHGTGMAAELIIPVLEERLIVQKRLVEAAGAKVHITVTNHDQVVEALLMHQDVVIERVPIGQDVAEPPAIRTEGDTIVIPVLEERLVTVKQLVLKEELRVRIDQTRRTVTQTVPLRREHAEIRPTNPTGDET